MDVGPLVLEKKIFEDLSTYGRGGYLCDQDAANIFSSPPLPMEAPHKIWLWLAKWFRRRCLNIVDDEDVGRTPELGYAISSYMSVRLRRA